MEPIRASFASLMRARYNELRGEEPPVPRSVPVPAPDPGELRMAQIKAALSGYFSPDAVFSIGIPEEQRRVILAALSGQCIIERSKDSVRWMLNLSWRHNVLKELSAEKLIENYLNGPLPQTDSQGRLLREVLQTKLIPGTEQFSIETLVDLTFVLEAIEPIDIEKPDPSVLHARLGREFLLTDFSVLLSNGFFGRKKEQQQLNNFIAAKANPNGANWLILAGIGGSGKSTLLAEFLQRGLLNSKVVITLLDFDRPGIHPADVGWLDAEISRQVGYQVVSGNSSLSEMRQATSNATAQTKEIVNESSSSFQSETRGVRSNVRQQVVDVMQSGEGVDGFILVLDTIEEVLDRNMFNNINEWLKDWNSLFQNSSLFFKVILSGRLNSSNLGNIREQTEAEVLPVGELNAGEAQEMLYGLQLSRAKARQLAVSPHIPRHPLELKLIAQFMQADPRLTISDLENELKNAGGTVAREFFAGVIYRRVLLRIQHEIARKIAYPGLVLRYVNRQILNEILLPALDLHGQDPQEIEQAFTELTSHQWLVSEDAAGNYWHRKDIRASMIRAIWSQEPEKAQKISRAAIDYFKRQKDNTEVFYHELMLYGDTSYAYYSNQDTLVKSAKELGSYINNFPYRGQVFVRYLIDGSISTKDIFILPLDHISKAYAERGRELVRARQFQEALLLIKAYEKLSNILHPAEGNDTWKMQTFIATVHWNEYLSTIKYVAYPRYRESIIKNHENTLETTQLSTTLSFLDNFGALLADLRYVEDLINTHKANPYSRTILKRFAAGAIRFNGLLPGSLKGRYSLRSFIEKFGQLLRAKDNYQIYERDYYLLYSLVHTINTGVKAVIKVNELSISPLAIRRLDTPGLYPFNSRHADFLTDWHATIFKNGLRKTKPTSRDLLNNIDAFANLEANNKLILPIEPSLYAGKDLLKVLRGPDPEFRDPARYAILDAFTTQDDYRSLARILAKVLPFDFLELDPEIFIDLMMRNAESTFESLVELIDRCWSLGKLLNLAIVLKPDKTKLQLVHESYSRWDSAITQAILSINAPPPGNNSGKQL